MARRWRDPFTASYEYRRSYITNRWWMSAAAIVVVGGLLLDLHRWYTAILGGLLIAVSLIVIGIGIYVGPRGRQ